MTAFITGATGFVGGGVLKLLSDGSREVRALARDRTGGEHMAARGAIPVIGDLQERTVLREAMTGCDVVYHVAGVNQMCASDPAEMMRVNVDGSRNVIQAAAASGVQRVVFTSSAVTMGEKARTVATEATTHRGRYLSHYERSKHESEGLMFTEGERLGVEVVAVNPSSVQGPGRTRGSAKLLLDVLNSRVPVLVQTSLSIVDIDDCAEGHLLAERHGVAGERYLLSAASLTVREAVELIVALTGRKSFPVYVPRWALRMGAPLTKLRRRRSEDGSVFCKEAIATLLHGHRYDGSRATRELGLEYRTLSDSMRRTIRWYVDYSFVRSRLPNFLPSP